MFSNDQPRNYAFLIFKKNIKLTKDSERFINLKNGEQNSVEKTCLENKNLHFQKFSNLYKRT